MYTCFGLALTRFNIFVRLDNIKFIAVFVLFLPQFLTPVLAEPYSSLQIVDVQKNLSGYWSGKADGKFSDKLTQAIKSYQSDWELDVTGEISDKLIQRLERVHVETASRWQKYQYRDDCRIWNSSPQAQETVEWSGNCSNDEALGKGKLVWHYVKRGKQIRVSYEGDFRDGKLHGQGIYTNSNGSRSEGYFRDGKLHGQGLRIWPTGHRYEGGFKNGKLEGKGIYKFAAGDFYEGEFIEGERGKGVITPQYGESYTVGNTLSLQQLESLNIAFDERTRLRACDAVANNSSLSQLKQTLG